MRWSLGLLLLVGITLSSVARADEIPKKYTRHFNSGVVQYRAGRYEAALNEFLAAAVVKQRVNAVLNIAQCHRMLDRPREAIKFYRSYLKQWKRENPGKRSRFHAEVQPAVVKEQSATVGPFLDVVQMAVDQDGITHEAGPEVTILGMTATHNPSDSQAHAIHPWTGEDHGPVPNTGQTAPGEPIAQLPAGPHGDALGQPGIFDDLGKQPAGTWEV